MNSSIKVISLLINVLIVEIMILSHSVTTYCESFNSTWIETDFGSTLKPNPLHKRILNVEFMKENTSIGLIRPERIPLNIGNTTTNQRNASGIKKLLMSSIPDNLKQNLQNLNEYKVVYCKVHNSTQQLFTVAPIIQPPTKSSLIHRRGFGSSPSRTVNNNSKKKFVPLRLKPKYVMVHIEDYVVCSLHANPSSSTESNKHYANNDFNRLRNVPSSPHSNVFQTSRTTTTPFSQNDSLYAQEKSNDSLRNVNPIFNRNHGVSGQPIKSGSSRYPKIKNVSHYFTSNSSLIFQTSSILPVSSKKAVTSHVFSDSKQSTPSYSFTKGNSMAYINQTFQITDSGNHTSSSTAAPAPSDLISNFFKKIGVTGFVRPRVPNSNVKPVIISSSKRRPFQRRKPNNARRRPSNKNNSRRRQSNRASKSRNFRNRTTKPSVNRNTLVLARPSTLSTPTFRKSTFHKFRNLRDRQTTPYSVKPRTKSDRSSLSRTTLFWKKYVSTPTPVGLTRYLNISKRPSPNQRGRIQYHRPVRKERIRVYISPDLKAELGINKLERDKIKKTVRQQVRDARQKERNDRQEKKQQKISSTRRPTRNRFKQRLRDNKN